MINADLIARWIADKGITHSFGIIGGGNVVLWDAINKLGRTKLVCVHHEQAAAMAATYYYRYSGRICLCLVTTGAGSTNVITGVMAAWMDSQPLLVLSGNEASKYMSAHTRVHGVQGYDCTRVASDFTKKSYRLMAFGEHEKSMLDMLLGISLTPRMGPVWIDVPKDVQSGLVR